MSMKEPKFNTGWLVFWLVVCFPVAFVYTVRYFARRGEWRDNEKIQ